jgi:hypothetical protein
MLSLQAVVLVLSLGLQDHSGHKVETVLDQVRAQEGSGTAWQPAETPMSGLHWKQEGWDLMAHASIFAGYDRQESDRGEDALVSMNWLMLMARRPLGGGEITLRGMISLEPWSVKDRGYPLLLQSGETFNGQPIHDRQHPHDLFMELASAWSAQIMEGLGVQFYAAIVGEPALGPVAFMHRHSASADPFAPLGHHWQDSTHISPGVLTAGIFTEYAKLEASWFNGREPDDKRIDLDLDVPDSVAVRLSVNPVPAASFQVSAGRLDEPEEELEPGVSVRRTTASAMVAGKFGREGAWSATAVWGRNDPSEGPTTNSYLAEATVDINPRHTVFGRLESLRKTGHDLDLGPGFENQKFGIAALSLGYIFNFTRYEGQDIGMGVCLTLNFLDDDLDPAYGETVAPGVMLFLRLRPVGRPDEKHH